MSNKSVSQMVEEHISPIVKELGYELVEVEYAKKSTGMNMTVYIDSPHGITLDDCEKVHSSIDEPLDILDPTSGASYILNVSSLGLDRPLKTDRDLERNIGEMVDVSLYSKLNGKKLYEAVLKSFSDKELIIVENNKDVVILREQISKITKHISF